MVKHEVKWKMIDGMDKEELVLLKFTKEEIKTKLRWKHSREFEYKQQMYDIVEFEEKENYIYYWCWGDTKETKLNKQLAQLIAQTVHRSPEKKEKQKQLKSIYKSLYYSEGIGEKLKITYTEKDTYSGYNIALTSLVYPPPVPPPKLS